MNINLEYYKVFYYVCTAGSLTAAAQKLCISQPAVSQAVRQLEKEALLVATTRAVRGVVAVTEKAEGKFSRIARIERRRLKLKDVKG